MLEDENTSLEELKVSEELLLNELELTSTKLDELGDIEELLGVPDTELEDEAPFTLSSPEQENAYKAANVKIAVSKVDLALFMFEM
jgi:hypothetical protein